MSDTGPSYTLVGSTMYGPGSVAVDYVLECYEQRCADNPAAPAKADAE